MPISELSQPWPGKKKEAIKPTTIPGRVIESGMIWCSRSMKVTTTSAEQKRKSTAKARLGPNLRNRARVRAPLMNSTSGYCSEMGAPQRRHFPCKAR